jgi:hypothetical protein
MWTIYEDYSVIKAASLIGKRSKSTQTQTPATCGKKLQIPGGSHNSVAAPTPHKGVHEKKIHITRPQNSLTLSQLTFVKAVAFN